MKHSLFRIIQEPYVGFRKIPYTIKTDETKDSYHIIVVERHYRLVTHPVLSYGEKCGIVLHSIYRFLFLRFYWNYLVSLKIRHGHSEHPLHCRLIVGIGVVAVEMAPALHLMLAVEVDKVFETASI